MAVIHECVMIARECVMVTCECVMNALILLRVFSLCPGPWAPGQHAPIARGHWGHWSIRKPQKKWFLVWNPGCHYVIPLRHTITLASIASGRWVRWTRCLLDFPGTGVTSLSASMRQLKRRLTIPLTILLYCLRGQPSRWPRSLTHLFGILWVARKAEDMMKFVLASTWQGASISHNRTLITHGDWFCDINAFRWFTWRVNLLLALINWRLFFSIQGSTRCNVSWP